MNTILKIIRAKSFVSVLISAALLMAAATGAYAEPAEYGAVTLVLNGKAVTLDSPPVMINDRVMLPFRTIAEALGATVTWNEGQQKVSLILGDRYVEMAIGSNTMYYGSMENPDDRHSGELDTPPIILDGRTLVPLQAFANALGAEASFSTETGTVYITAAPQAASVRVWAERTTYTTGQRGVATVSVPEGESFTLSSSSPYVLSVSQDGAFSCLSAGTARVTAATPGGVTGGVDITVINLDEFAGEVLRLTNAERANNGLAALSGDYAALNEAARVRAKELPECFDHKRPNGATCYTAFDEAGVSYTAAGENVASGQTSPEMVVREWMDSAGHRNNILSTSVAYLGVGVVMGENGVLYWAQEFCN